MGGLERARGAVRDLGDVLGRARSPVEVLKAFVPPGLARRRVLNDGVGLAVVPGRSPATEVAASLRRLTRRLEGAALASDGCAIDYGAVAGSAIHRELEETAARLRGLDAAHVGTPAQQLAFWINLYNVLVVHGIVALGIRESVMEVPSFFASVAYRIGPWTFTPDDIENGVLRANSGHPATGLRPFRRRDPRLACCVDAVDPRVHMALVCAARSCPPIAFYDAEDIDAQLDTASRGFVRSDVDVDAPGRRIVLSVIFRYYLRDFGGIEGLRDFLLARLDGECRAALARAWDAGWPVVHRRYDWSLNGMRGEGASV